jgi:hypothetical protein
MPDEVQLYKVIEHLQKHPALMKPGDTSATFTETYVVAFDFRRADKKEILRHEQEFGASYNNDEMEWRRKSWIVMEADSDRKSPMILSMMDFES